MEIRVYDTSLEPLGILDELTSVLWSPKYQGVGTIKILAPLTENNLALLQKGVILVKHDDTDAADADGNTWRRAAQIHYVELSKNTEGAEVIDAQGTFLSEWLSRRVIKNKIVATDVNSALAERIVRENLGEDAETSRQFPLFTIRTSSILDEDSIEYTHDTKVNVGIAIYDRAISGDLGYDIFVDERNKMFGFWVYQGADLTQGNTADNAPCVFAPDFDNVLEQEYIESDEDYKNLTYVDGITDDETLQTVEVGTATGLERRELYTDATALAQTYTDEDGNEVTMSLAEFLEALRQLGVDSIADYGESVSFSSEINNNANLVYRSDYDIGDKVTCVNKAWGLRIDARVTGVTETMEQGKSELSVTFGAALPTLLQKIRKVR